MSDLSAVNVSLPAWEEMSRHVRVETPNEAVGLLGGPSFGVISTVYPLPNIGGPSSFFADPYSQFMAEKTLRRAHLQVVGYYHSHPGGGLELSALDRTFATRKEWLYLLLVTDFRGEGEIRGAAYRYINGTLTKVPMLLKTAE